jgi:hypothetical protein
VTAPHVDVDVAALDLGTRVHDGVDAVVAVAEALDLDDGTDRQDVRVGGGNPGADVDPRGGRRPLAVGGCREAQPGAGRQGGPLAHFGLPGRVAGIQRGHLVEEREGDGGRGSCHDLASCRTRQEHGVNERQGRAPGGKVTIPAGLAIVKPN